MTGSYVWLRTTANQVVQWKIRLQVQVIWWKIDQEGPSKGAWTNNQKRQKIQCLGKLWQHWMCWDNALIKRQQYQQSKLMYKCMQSMWQMNYATLETKNYSTMQNMASIQFYTKQKSSGLNHREKNVMILEHINTLDSN
ncbi:hypothetical protein MTP99_012215 [Tenebrio molitor]|nr:hypothetical protein MTP99_012215 [Tenebrio molitor]